MQAMLAQQRRKPGADLAVSFGDSVSHGLGARGHVAPEVPRYRDPSHDPDWATVQDDHPPVAVCRRWQPSLDDDLAPAPVGGGIQHRADVGIGSVENEDPRPAMPSVGLSTATRLDLTRAGALP